MSLNWYLKVKATISSKLHQILNWSHFFSLQKDKDDKNSVPHCHPVKDVFFFIRAKLVLQHVELVLISPVPEQGDILAPHSQHQEKD